MPHMIQRDKLHAFRARLVENLKRQKLRQQCQAAEKTESRLRLAVNELLKRGW